MVFCTRPPIDAMVLIRAALALRKLAPCCCNTARPTNRADMPETCCDSITDGSVNCTMTRTMPLLGPSLDTASWAPPRWPTIKLTSVLCACAALARASTLAIANNVGTVRGACSRRVVDEGLPT